MTTAADQRVRSACARARALLEEYEACAAGADGHDGQRSWARHLEELRTRIDGELRHAGRAALELAAGGPSSVAGDRRAA